MNRNYKAYKPFIGLILIILAALSFGLVKFNTSSTIVKADSIIESGASNSNNLVVNRGTNIPASDFCTWGNTVTLMNQSEITETSDGLDTYSTITFIYKFEEPVSFQIRNPKLTCLITADTNETDCWIQCYPASETVGSYLPANQEFTLPLLYRDNEEGYAVSYDYQYIQVFAPYTWTCDISNPLLEKCEFSFTDYNGSVYTPELAYIVVGNSLSNTSKGESIQINNNFNVPTVTSVDELSSEIEYRYLTFKGIYGSNDADYSVGFDVFDETILNEYTVSEFKWLVYKDEAYPTMTFEEIFTSMESTTVHSYYTSRLDKHKFIGWDRTPEELDYLQSWTVNAMYEPVEVLEYPITFYGMENEVVYSTTIKGLADKKSTFQKDLTSAYTEAINVAVYKFNNGQAVTTSPYYNKYFTEWSIPYSENLWESVEGAIEVYGTWEFENIDYNVNIYDKDFNLVETIIVKNGTLFGELGLTAPEVENHYFSGFRHFDTKDGMTTLHGILEAETMIEDSIVSNGELNIVPEYVEKVVTVRIITRVVYEKYNPVILINEDGCYTIDGYLTQIMPSVEGETTPEIGVDTNGFWTLNGISTIIKAKTETWSSSFVNEDLLIKEFHLGETITLPLPVYYDGCVPKFYTTNDSHINYENYDAIYVTRICDASANRITIPDDDNLISQEYRIYLVYRQEQNEIIDNTPLDENGILPTPGKPNNDNNNKQDNNSEENKAEPNYMLIGLITCTVLLLVISISVAVEIIKRRNYGNRR